MISHTPNTVFFLIAPSGALGTTVLFLDRQTGAQMESGDHLEGVPENFRATQLFLLGKGNQGFFYATTLSPQDARTALESAGFVAHSAMGGPAPDKAPTAWTPPPPPAKLTPKDLVFDIGTRMEGPDGTTPNIEVGLYNRVEMDAWREDDGSRNFDDHEVGVEETTLETDARYTALIASGDTDAIRAGLIAMGAQDAGTPAHWYAPDALEFGVALDDNGDTTLFILPKDPDARHSDCLGTDNLQVCPDWFDTQTMENTWVFEGRDVDTVRTALIALGYTHNPDLDEDLM